MTLRAHAEQSVADVEAGRVTLPEGLMQIGGFCGRKTRQLVHRLCQAPVRSYLEIGVLHGATLCAAASASVERVIGIDNFSQFDGDEATVRSHLARWQGDRSAEFFNVDCFELSPYALRKPTRTEQLGRVFSVGLFYYDGDHSAEATAQALTHYLPLLAEPFLLLVDDYSWLHVQQGVAAGLEQAGLRAAWSCELGVGMEGDGAGWWNGLFLALVEPADG